MKRTSQLAIAAGCLAFGAIAGFLLNTGLLLQAQPEPRPIAAIPRELTSYRDIVKQVLPAVVSIEAKLKPKRLMFQDGLVVPESARVQGPKAETLGSGSGVIVDPKGVILTNYHVVDGADSLDVRLPDGRKFISKDWRVDRKTDLAIVRIESDRPLPFLQLGDSDGMEVGDRVLAIGAPFGLTGSVTHGIISAKSRNIRLNQYEDFLQTDAAINPGNSGGPLISLDGKVIGINSAIKSKTGGFQGVGLAISSNLARNVISELVKNGSVKRGFLGVQIRDVDGELAVKRGVKEGAGVLITHVFDQSPAFKAGLKVNDIVLTIGGKPVRDGVELQKVVAALPVDQSADVVLNRDGKSLQLKLVIEEQPDEFGNNPPKNK